MSIAIKITEVGNTFFVGIESQSDKGLNRVIMQTTFLPENRSEVLDQMRSYANGVSDGMNLMRSIMPVVHWSGRVETV